MKQLKRALLIFLIGAFTACQASPGSSFFATHQQTMLFTAGSFVLPVMVANIALLVAKKASIRSAFYSLLSGVPCGATLLARYALDRWTTLPDDQLLYYGGWCAVGLTAIVGTLVSHFKVRKGDTASLIYVPTDLAAAAFGAFFFIKLGTGTLRFANWIAEIKR